MFGIGGTELVIIVIFALFLFGPDKIPEVIKTLKKAVAMYTDARDQVTEVVNTQILSPEELDMLKDPLGLNKLKGSAESILTPDRLNLIQQNTPPQEAAETKAPATAADSIWASLTGDSDSEGSN